MLDLLSVLLPLRQLERIRDAVNFRNIHDRDVPDRQVKRRCHTLDDAFWGHLLLRADLKEQFAEVLRLQLVLLVNFGYACGGTTE